ncbi:MAG: MotA/TolQ/ExbB proton channel family protein [Alphaproteobacteria bacterium]|nr:MotA/TolQ/ExbB proton channel family protein [Alphaproteobacteria bacterium]
MLLLAMSVAAWTVMLAKGREFALALRAERTLAGLLDSGRHERPAAPSGALVMHELRERRQRLESGLPLLATIGNVAPFVGLLGTVWGIVHALRALGGAEAVNMAMVAGPVAEALVATAAGLFAAIPAVVAYNHLLRRLSIVALAMEGNAQRILHPPREETA